MYTKISVPEKPKLIFEAGNAATYEIAGLYPGYGTTVGNVLRRTLLSSVPGAAITTFRIDGVPHEFSTIEGVAEDVLQIRLNLKQVRVSMLADDAQELVLEAKGVHEVTAGDIQAPSTCVIANPTQKIMTLTRKDSTVRIAMTVERGLGFVSAENLKQEKLPEGIVKLDARFSPIQRVVCKVEDMRIGDRADFNRLIVEIETDGTVSPHDAFNHALTVAVDQLEAIRLE